MQVTLNAAVNMNWLRDTVASVSNPTNQMSEIAQHG